MTNSTAGRLFLRTCTVVAIGYAALAGATTQVAIDRTIIQISAYADRAHIKFTPAVPGLEGCTYAAGDQVATEWQSAPDAKAMYATAIAAFHAGRLVGFGVNGCNVSGLPIAYRIDERN